MNRRINFQALVRRPFSVYVAKQNIYNTKYDDTPYMQKKYKYFFILILLGWIQVRFLKFQKPSMYSDISGQKSTEKWKKPLAKGDG